MQTRSTKLYTIPAKLLVSKVNVFTCAGLHYIPLRTSGGESASHTGIFVRIEMSKLNPKQATSSGMCSEQDLKNCLPIRWSSSKLLETCPSSPDIEEEYKLDDVQCKQNKCEDKSTGISSCSNDTSNTQKQTRRVRRHGVVERCIVEVHTKPSDDDIV